MKHRNFIISVIIILFCIIFYIPFLGDVPLFDWDELNFAESSREMIVSENYARVMVNFKPFWEKPPLFFWIQTISMKVFGIGEFGARFPNVICGIITLLMIFHIGRKYHDTLFGIFWSLSFAGSFLPHLYFKTGIIDPFFNLFIFSGVFFLFRTFHPDLETEREWEKNISMIQSYRNKQLMIAGFFIGTAILTKGPVALLISLLCLGVYFSVNHFKKFISFKEFIIFCFVSGFISLLWFGPETYQNGFWFLGEFIRYQLALAGTSQAGHGQPFYYHFVVLFFGCFPSSIFAIFSLFTQREESPLQRSLRIWMQILFWIVLLLFSIVTTKILHYSSLCYLPMTYLSANTLYAIVCQRQNKLSLLIKILFGMGILYSFLFLSLPFIGKMLPNFIDKTNDIYIKEAMKIQVDWGLNGIWIGILFLICNILFFLIFKKGKTKLAIGILFGGTAIIFELLLIYIIPKVNTYTQEANVNFFKSLRNKDVYIEVLGHRSYGYLFYSDKQPSKTPSMDEKHWLVYGEIDKPAYFVVKKSNVLKEIFNPELRLIKEENGFCFYERLPKVREGVP